MGNPLDILTSQKSAILQNNNINKTLKNNASEIDALSISRNVNKTVFATLKINSISGKFYQLKCIISKNIDVLVLSEL